ncbi:F0F1 ATP synthase subunit delta [Pelagibacterium xiamenense]|uniref:F0F1 ATP synthase subunit delta n=1 Tax=Pelagibacterium xiamenense TaxID=2901140 RepID=UPI001E33A9E4|nr:F0F1 ATP synthase subunit delta [Pelagibacterium xiamenense]MCD7058270.1 F0F1 ATP synthase subunit delta [Pelagibacterium xiamenense]
MSATHSVLFQIGRPYATALFDLASEANAIEDTEKSLDAIAALIDSNDDFAKFLESPTITADKKGEVLEAILAKAKTPELVANTLRLVAKNGRLYAVPAIISLYKDLAADARNEVSADVVSAAPLSDAQSAELAKVLKDKIGKAVSLKTRVDESLIGGLVVKVGSKMIDTSLKTKLSAMKIAMKGVS